MFHLQSLTRACVLTLALGLGLPGAAAVAADDPGGASTPASGLVADTTSSMPAPAGPAAAGPSESDPPAVATVPAPAVPHVVPVAQVSAGDTAWLIVASALVLLMNMPGLALFYAGMVRKKNILATMAQTIATCALVTVLWWAIGYSLAFRPGTPWIGDLEARLLQSVRYDRLAGLVSVHPSAPTVPESVFVMFQMTFAIITPALIAGAFAERMRFQALLCFMGAWSLLVYAPIAHWVWAPGGWLAGRGMLDFAGGTVVHVNAGVAGLVAAYYLGPREGYGREPLRPANLAYTMMGAALLWVGWMGFNGGSAGAADGRAGLAMLVTQIAAATAALGWMFAEWMVRGRPSLLGISSGAVAGLVAITPASGFVGPSAAVAIGAMAGLGCYWGATGLKQLLGADDSLDVFGVHGVGGTIGALMTGALASPAIGGVSGDLFVQATGVGATMAYSAAGSLLILWVVDRFVGLRVTPQQEREGLDRSLHGEQVD